jgi:hypothetical protein
VAKKRQQQDDRGGALGEVAESLGTLLGNAEKQWKAWQGPRDAIVTAVTDVRDRAAALLAEMGVPEAVARARDAKDAATGKKAGKKKDKDGKKAGRKAKKAEKAAQAEAAKADGKKPGKADKGKKGKKKDKGASPDGYETSYG